MNKYLREKFIDVRESDAKPTQLQMLTEMIEDIMSLSIPVITEESAPAPKVRTYNISEIPMIPISELGWANADDDVDTDDPNAPPSQRRGLEQYLSKIPGTGFADKLNDVSNIMDKGIGDMFALYDIMRQIKKTTEIHTIGMGKVMSAGVLLLAAGTKGHRKIGKNCRVMIHSVIGGNHGPLHNLMNEMEAIEQIQKMYSGALITETNMSKSDLKDLLERKVNVYLTAEEAVELGIADIII